jgi:hypothetical protein
VKTLALLLVLMTGCAAVVDQPTCESACAHFDALAHDCLRGAPPYPVHSTNAGRTECVADCRARPWSQDAIDCVQGIDTAECVQALECLAPRDAGR